MNDLTTASIKELEEKLLTETDSDELQNIADLFKLNIQKKNILRTNKLSDLQDAISEQMSKRVELQADQLSNKDLIDYFKAVQGAITSTDAMINPEDFNIQLNQLNQVNVNVNEPNVLNRASRMKVIDAVNAILKKAENQVNEPSLDSLEEVEIDESNIEETTKRID